MNIFKLFIYITPLLLNAANNIDEILKLETKLNELHDSRIETMPEKHREEFKKSETLSDLYQMSLETQEWLIGHKIDKELVSLFSPFREQLKSGDDVNDTCFQK